MISHFNWFEQSGIIRWNERRLGQDMDFSDAPWAFEKFYLDIWRGLDGFSVWRVGVVFCSDLVRIDTRVRLQFEWQWHTHSHHRAAREERPQAVLHVATLVAKVDREVEGWRRLRGCKKRRRRVPPARWRRERA